MNQYPPTLLCDFYKLSHRQQYPKGTEVIYSTWTPRSNKHMPEVDYAIAFGFQGFIKEWLIDFFDENFFNTPISWILRDYKRIVTGCLGDPIPYTKHIEELHELGYLPLLIKALPEGTRVPMRVPMMTIHNTDPRFFWLTNYLETLCSCELWQPSTSATIASHYRKILDKYAMETVGNTDFVPFQGHDFSMRGMEGVHAAACSGSGHLTSFVGTDTIPAIRRLERFYGADVTKELVGCSVPATEHSVMCAGGDGADEYETYKRLVTEVYPSGIVSIVSDTWDLWHVVTDTLPKLKDSIMAREGKVVIRPDSGDPVDILCGTNVTALPDAPKEYKEWRLWVKEDLHEKLLDETPHGEYGGDIKGYYRFEDKTYECHYDPDWNRHDKQYYFIDEYGDQMNEEEVSLSAPDKGLVELLWETFGGTTNSLGYKELDPHIGAIYGDSITPERAGEICKRLKAKGFASTNVVYGIGSYTYQMKTRDSLGFAMKSTLAVIDGEERFIYKDPVTDDGTKKSLTGAVYVDCDHEGWMVIDKQTLGSDSGMLQTIFKDGTLTKETTLQEIRGRILKDG